MTNKLGEHYIVEFINCQKGLTNKTGIHNLLEQAVKSTNSTLVHIDTHFFPISDDDMGGVSGIAILLESHISIHTWAEYNYVAIDIFTCGSHTDPANALPLLINFFKPEIIKIKIIERGY